MQISNQAVVEFRIERNEGVGARGYAIIENPGTEYEVVRSPYGSAKAARIREHEIAEYWGYQAKEVK